MNALGTPLGRAAETPKCNEVLKACDKAIKEQKDVIDINQKALDKSQEQVKALKDEVSAKEGMLKNPIRQPTVLVGAGVIAALLGGPIAGLGGLIIVSVLFK